MQEPSLTPSTAWLLAFESAARHVSFTRAGMELRLTQSAVSRQVQCLENMLGTALFERQGKRLLLTPAGREYAEQLRPALRRIRDATLHVRRCAPAGNRVSLAVLPAFGSKILLPVLADFHRENPHVEVHVHSRIGHYDQVAEGLDLAVRVGCVEDWPDLCVTVLAAEQLVPVISPRLKQRMPVLRRPEDLVTCQLLQVASRPAVWTQWFDRYAPRVSPPLDGQRFELTTHLLQALDAEMGIALLPDVLLADDIRRGVVTMALAGDFRLSTGLSYCLTAAESVLQRPAVATLHQWLCAMFCSPSLHRVPATNADSLTRSGA